MSCESVVIATASDAGYLPAACCQLKSAWDHLRNWRHLPLFLVICDVDREDQEQAKRFFRERGVPVKIIVADDLANRVRPVNRRWPRSAYLRLHFDSIFGRDIERLIYFDADTRVCAPLEKLVNAPLRGAPVGAVHDLIYYVTGNIHRRRRDLFLSDDAPYLQSGVMVFDWPATLEDGGLARARQFLDSHPDRCQEAPDQDALNAALEGKWTPLDPRWNLHETYLMFGGSLEPFIEHYTSSKPWSRLRRPTWKAAAAWYRRELAGTAWADFVEPQSSLDKIHTRLRFFKFRCAPHVREMLVRYSPFLWNAACWHHDSRPLDPLDEVLPWAPKSRKDVEEMAQALVAEAQQRRPRLLPPEAVLAQGSKAIG